MGRCAEEIAPRALGAAMPDCGAPAKAGSNGGIMSDPAEHLARNLLPIARIAGNDTRWTMEERIAHYRCPGLSVAVMDGGEVAWSAGYGHMEEGKPERVDAQTMFSGASISKPVTALLALQQVD